MSLKENELRSLQNIGIRLKKWALYSVIALILVFFFTIIFAQSINSMVNDAENLSSFVNQAVGRLIVFSVLVTLVYLFELTFVYKLNQRIDKASKLSDINLTGIEDAKKYFRYYVIVAFGTQLITLFNAIRVANNLRASASASLDELNNALAVAESGTIMIGILNVIPRIILIFAIVNFNTYFESLYRKFKINAFTIITDKIKLAKNGTILLAIAGIIMVFPNESISWLLSLPGSVLLIYGTYKSGSRLTTLRPYDVGKSNGQSSSPSRRSSSLEALSSQNIVDQTQSHFYCEDCGTKNGEKYKYCNGCGKQLIEEK